MKNRPERRILVYLVPELEDHLPTDLIRIINGYWRDRVCKDCKKRINNYVPYTIKVSNQFECGYCIECIVNGCKRDHRKNSLFCFKHAFLEIPNAKYI